MSTKVVVETVYGKYHKFEIIREETTFSTKILLYRDGSYKGTYDSVAKAVEAAKKEG